LTRGEKGEKHVTVGVEKKESVFSGGIADIVSLTFRMGDKIVRIKKKETWIVEGELESAINQALLNDMIKDLMAMEKVSTVTVISKVGPGEFGFNDPFMIMTLGYKGKPSESLIIGDTHPSGRTYYAMMSGHEEIFLVGSAYPYLIDAKLKRLIR